MEARGGREFSDLRPACWPPALLAGRHSFLFVFFSRNEPSTSKISPPLGFTSPKTGFHPTPGGYSFLSGSRKNSEGNPPNPELFLFVFFAKQFFLPQKYPHPWGSNALQTPFPPPLAVELFLPGSRKNSDPPAPLRPPLQTPARRAIPHLKIPQCTRVLLSDTFLGPPFPP